MAREPLRMLRTVRLFAVEQARRNLAAALAAEAAIVDQLRALDAAAERDRAANDAVAEAYLFADTFARSRQARAEARRLAEANLAAAEAVSAQARAGLTAARTAAEAVDLLIDERARVVEANAQKREQHALDDIAGSRSDTLRR
jgi:flagellar export protein FliJ